jgi:hypothetical protein
LGAGVAAIVIRSGRIGLSNATREGDEMRPETTTEPAPDNSQNAPVEAVCKALTKVQ